MGKIILFGMLFCDWASKNSEPALVVGVIVFSLIMWAAVIGLARKENTF